MLWRREVAEAEELVGLKDGICHGDQEQGCTPRELWR